MLRLPSPRRSRHPMLPGAILLAAALVIGSIGLGAAPAYAASGPTATVTQVAPLVPSTAGLDSGVSTPLAWCAPTGGCEVVTTYSANGSPALAVATSSGTTEVSLATVDSAGVQLQLDAFGCASVGNCALVGTLVHAQVPADHIITSPETVLVALAQTGGTWGTPAIVPVSAAGNAFDLSLSNVSCPSTGDCAVAGEYYISTQSSGTDESAFVLAESGGTFATSVTPLALPGSPTVPNDNAPSAPTLACTSAGNCTLLGVQVDPTSNSHFDAFVASESSGTWGAPVLVTSLEDDSLLTLAGLDCFTSRCVALGTLGDSSGSGPFVVSGQGTSWGSPSMIAFPSSTDAASSAATALACVSASDCVAIGSSPLGSGSGGSLNAFVALGSSSGTFGNASLVELQSTLPADTQEYVVGSCDANNTCVVAGNTAGSPVMVASATYANSTWSTTTPVQATSPSGTSGLVPTAVACGSSGCGVYGTLTQSSGATGAFSAVASNGSWSASPLTLPKDATNLPSYASVLTVSCSSPSECAALAVDDSANGTSMLLPLTETNGAWSAQPITIPASLAGDSFGVQDLTCQAAGDCTGIGARFDTTTGASGVLAISETNGTWGVTALPSPANLATPFGYISLTSLSCAGVGDCSTIGTYLTSTGDQQLVAYTETNGTWSMAEPATPASSAGPVQVSVHGLVCFTASNCTGIANLSSGPVVLTQTNGTWSVAPLPALGSSFPSGASSPTINALACPSAGSCTATGIYSISQAVAGALAYTETNGTWSVTELPLPANATTTAQDPVTSSVTCTAAGACTALGYYQTQTGPAGDFEPMVLTETNGSWSATELPLPSNAAVTNSQFPETGTIACPSAGSCVATGVYTATAGSALVDDPVVWSEGGGTWSATEPPLPTYALPPIGTGYSEGPLVGNLSCPTATSCAAAYTFPDQEGDELGAIYSLTSATSVASAVLTQIVTPSTTTQTFTGTANGATISVSVPAGAFGSQTVELVLTEPTLSSLTSALAGLGLSGDTLATGVGVEVLDPATGQPLTGSFALPITVTITSSAITSSSTVVEFPATGSPFVDTAATVSAGQAIVVLASDPTFAIANPSAVVPATHTGEPWAGSVSWWVLEAALFAGGALALTRNRPRPAHARRH